MLQERNELNSCSEFPRECILLQARTQWQVSSFSGRWPQIRNRLIVSVQAWVGESNAWSQRRVKSLIQWKHTHTHICAAGFPVKYPLTNAAGDKKLLWYIIKRGEISCCTKQANLHRREYKAEVKFRTTLLSHTHLLRLLAQCYQQRYKSELRETFYHASVPHSNVSYRVWILWTSHFRSSRCTSHSFP